MFGGVQNELYAYAASFCLHGGVVEEKEITWETFFDSRKAKPIRKSVLKTQT